MRNFNATRESSFELLLGVVLVLQAFTARASLEKGEYVGRQSGTWGGEDMPHPGWRKAHFFAELRRKGTLHAAFNSIFAVFPWTDVEE